MEECSRSDGTEGPTAEEPSSAAAATTSANPRERIKYGELTILGYNGSLPQGDKGRKRSKLVLFKERAATGVKKSRHYVVKVPDTSEAVLDSEQYSISYTINREQTVIVEYEHDEETDMFQIGRSPESSIDFVVTDTVPGDRVSRREVTRNTVSRFACRLVCERNNPKVVRILAAGFDSKRNIFLGEKGCKWQEDGGDIDGITTNGVFIMHPLGIFRTGDALSGVWGEVSICGEMSFVRNSRATLERGPKLDTMTNVLQDGTLIDLGGATLMWRSAEGLATGPSIRDLEESVNQIDTNGPTTSFAMIVMIPRRLRKYSNDQSTLKQRPVVYTDCGHVQGVQDWRRVIGDGRQKCPTCRKFSPVVRLCMGMEPAFCVAKGVPNYAFVACGHMADEKTIKYWSRIAIPYRTTDFHSVCPFCLREIEEAPGFVKLIFSTRTG